VRYEKALELAKTIEPEFQIRSISNIEENSNIEEKLKVGTEE
jgi:hypothetical protein